jgi:hypothetical protein
MAAGDKKKAKEEKVEAKTLKPVVVNVPEKIKPAPAKAPVTASVT